ncbi:MAG TPA: hypothetical protein VM532_02125 [Burkholderiales bacterium]|jgi:hypothetical protein|nr:hypothetical protein [Burkholderiales bacterium]
MIEMTWVGDALRWVGGLYWLLAIGALALAITKIKPMAGKVISVAAIVALFGYLPITAALENKKATDARKAAWVHFEMRCKSAGEKIYKTIDEVEGIYLMKLRPPKKQGWSEDQFYPDDLFSTDGNGVGEPGIFRENLAQKRPHPDTYISSFLWPQNSEGALERYLAGAGPYRYVDTLDERDGINYRYTRNLFNLRKRYGDKFIEDAFESELLRSPVSQKDNPRYGVTWADISTQEDRTFWIAGGSIKIVDLETNEVIAERIGFLIDPGQGNRGGARSPWSWAQHYGQRCPVTHPTTLAFVEKVLKPKRI